MTISFDLIPSSIRRPFAYFEFNSANAVQGSQIKTFKTLIIGQKTSSGTATSKQLIRVTTSSDIETLFGAGSQLYWMLKAYFLNNDYTETWVVALDDKSSGGVTAVGTFALSGVATADGVLSVYIGGKLVSVTVEKDDTAAEVATALRAAINSDTELPVDDGGSDGNVTVTCKNKGLEGNRIDLRINYQSDEALPAGIACAITPMASGAGSPDISDAFDALSSDQYDVIIHPYTDSANIGIIDETLEDKWGPFTQNDGHAFSSSNLAYADLATLGNSYNSKHCSIVGCTKSPSLPWSVAAALGGVVAIQMSNDPARPLTDLVLDGILAPAQGERLTDSERNLLLYDGISTLKVDSGGNVCIERIITTYKKNGAGADDTSFLDIMSKYTASYLRYDLRTTILRKYPRYKVADDGTRFGSGQSMITPKTLKSEIIAIYAQWEEKGLVEGREAFKNALIVERNESDPNRIDVYLTPDFVNQWMVTAGQIAFFL